jgi:hypothetical protein
MAKKKAKEGKKEEYYVSIEEPVSVRVSLLEARKAVLESMKVFREIKQIRKQKAEQKANLRKQLRQLSLIISKIKAEMPYVKYHPSEVAEQKPVPVEVEEKEEEAEPEEKKEEKVSVKKPADELERIEGELAEIEAKLGSL